ncbi:MAG: hypothetical protein C5B50_09450, partial [Verrucomicrobia bacterium]
MKNHEASMSALKLLRFKIVCAAAITVGIFAQSPACKAGLLINMDLGDAAAASSKTGFAAIGQTANDFWNWYNRQDGQGHYKSFGAVANLSLADGTPTQVGMTIANAPGAWYNGSTDPMYNVYLYPLSGGNVTVTITNLPAGQYDVLPYANDGNYEVTVGGTSYGSQSCLEAAVTNPPVWKEGVQYVRFRNVQVAAGQALVLTVRPGTFGYAVISGFQIVQSVINPLLNVDLGDATNVSSKAGFAAIGQTASDFWNYYNRQD